MQVVRKTGIACFFVFCPPVRTGGFYAENAECWHESKQSKKSAAL